MLELKNFKREEFACSHCGENKISDSTLTRLQALRTEYGKPMVVTSGYRCPKHPVEVVKPTPGAHSTGNAVDIRAEGDTAFEIIRLAIKHGFTGIGVSQKKSLARFIHLDDYKGPLHPRPRVWSY